MILSGGDTLGGEGSGNRKQVKSYTERVTVLLTTEQRQALDRAVVASGKTLSDFLRDSLLEQIRDFLILQGQNLDTESTLPVES